MKRKKAIKKILNHFNVQIPVKYSVYGYALSLNDRTNEFKCLMVQNPNMRSLPDDIDKAFNRHFKQNVRLPITEELFSVLHEIGHIKTDSMDFEDYSEEVEILSELYHKNLIDIDSYVQLYSEIQAEADANRWAIAWVKANPAIAQRFDSFMR